MKKLLRSTFSGGSNLTVSAEQISSFIDTTKTLLLFSSKEEQYQWFKSIKSKQSFQSLVDEIKVEAEMLGKEPLRELSFFNFTRFRDTGSRLEYEKHYFNKRKRLNTFAFMCLLEPDQSKYLKELHEVIWSICNEYSWCLPAHLKDRPEMVEEIDFLKLTEQQGYTIDLFSAETAFALSEIYRLTEDVLDPLIKKEFCRKYTTESLHLFNISLISGKHPHITGAQFVLVQLVQLLYI